MVLELKPFFGIASGIISLVSASLYIRDILKGQSRPHAYTRLIWTISQGTALVGIWYGHGGWGILAILVSTISVFITFLLSLRRGTSNITGSDKIALAVALGAVVIWWQLNDPILAVALATGIDVVGYYPTWRKCVTEPWSEALHAWGISLIAQVLALLALAHYNFLTLAYPLSILCANLGVIFICLIFRRSSRSSTN